MSLLSRLYLILSVLVFQLRASCDYVISSRIAAIRSTIQDASSSNGQQQILKRVRAMASYCEKPVLIVEKAGKARVGGDDSVFGRSKQLDQIAFLSFEAKHTKILYSDNMKQTAELVKRMALAESKRGKALPVSENKVWFGFEG